MTSPPADRRRQLELEDHRETPEPRSAVEPLDAEHRKKEDRPTTEIDREKDQLVPPAVATTQVKIAADLDHIDRQLDGYMAAALKKPAASTKAMKKAMKKAAAVDGEVEEEDETSSDEGEDEKSIVVKAPKAKAGAKAKGAPKAKAKGKAKPVAEEATPSALKRPTSVDKGPPAKSPRLDEDDTVYFGGGRLYKADGNMVRAYLRIGDRNDKLFSFKDRKSLLVAWAKGCRAIVDDPRDVPE